MTLDSENPNDPCFDWIFGLVLMGLTFKNRGHLGSRLANYSSGFFFQCVSVCCTTPTQRSELSHSKIPSFGSTIYHLLYLRIQYHIHFKIKMKVETTQFVDRAFIFCCWWTSMRECICNLQKNPGESRTLLYNCLFFLDLQ